MANPSVCLSSVTCVHTIQGFNFSGIFLHLIVNWPSSNSSTKNHEDRPRGSPPPRGLNKKGVVKQANLAYRRIPAYRHVWLSHLLMSFLYINDTKNTNKHYIRRRQKAWRKRHFGKWKKCSHFYNRIKFSYWIVTSGQSCYMDMKYGLSQILRS